jgi:hypothetical protein
MAMNDMTANPPFVTRESGGRACHAISSAAPAALRVPSVHIGEVSGTLPMFMGHMRNPLEFQPEIIGLDLNTPAAWGFM